MEWMFRLDTSKRDDDDVFSVFSTMKDFEGEGREADKRVPDG